MGPIELSIRSSVAAGERLRTPIRESEFVVDRLDMKGLVLLLGRGRWKTVIPWQALEGIPDFLGGRDWVLIGGVYDVAGPAGSLDQYLKRWVYRATAGWVAVVLEKAGVVEIDRTRPARVRLTGQGF